MKKKVWKNSSIVLEKTTVFLIKVFINQLQNNDKMQKQNSLKNNK